MQFFERAEIVWEYAEKLFIFHYFQILFTLHIWWKYFGQILIRPVHLTVVMHLYLKQFKGDVFLERSYFTNSLKPNAPLTGFNYL